MEVEAAALKSLFAKWKESGGTIEIYRLQNTATAYPLLFENEGLHYKL